MFTGLISELGNVVNLNKVNNSYHLTINAQKTASLLKIGESIAVNGVCLTVVKQSANEFTVDVMPETVRLTVIGKLKIGEKVNLERTLRVGDGLDGHIVSGHVEDVGVINKITLDGIAKVIRIKTPAKLLRYIIPKGSIAIDGISLTVTEVTQNSFCVSLIPHTLGETTLGFKKVGDEVNLETDIIGKYVEQMLKKNNGDILTKESLLKNGFI